MAERARYEPVYGHNDGSPKTQHQLNTTQKLNKKHMCTNYNINTKVNIQISTKSRYRRTKMFVKRQFLKTFEIETQTQIQDTKTDIGYKHK